MFTKDKGGENLKSSDFVPTYKEIADVVGVDNAYKIHEHFRGQQMTFPQKYIVQVMWRDM